MELDEGSESWDLSDGITGFLKICIAAYIPCILFVLILLILIILFITYGIKEIRNYFKN